MDIIGIILKGNMLDMWSNYKLATT